MAYQYNIPQPTDQLSKSQGDIQGNFGALGAIGGNGNVASAALNGTAGFNFVMFPLPDATLPAFPTGKDALYLTAFTANTVTTNELTVHKIVQGSGAPTTANIPFTASIASNKFFDLTAGHTAWGQVGWTYLPSGILLKFGNITNSTPLPYDLNDASLGPAFTAVFGVQGTVTSGNFGSFSIPFSTVGGDKITVLTNISGTWAINYLAYGLGAGA